MFILKIIMQAVQGGYFPKTKQSIGACIDTVLHYVLQINSVNKMGQLIQM